MSQLNLVSHKSFNLSHYQFAKKISPIDSSFEMFVHDSNQLPSYSISQILSIPERLLENDFLYETVVFKRLPPPYNTNCRHYDKQIRSQAQCVNDLMIKTIKEYGCFPKNFDSLTFVIKNFNYTEFKYKFCDNNFSIPETKEQKQNCRSACYEEIYELTKEKTYDRIIELKPLNSKFISFEFYPKLVFLQYLINFGGLLGLWYGISLNDFKNIVSHFLKRIHLMNQFLRKFISYYKHFEIYKWFKIFIKYSQMMVRSFLLNKYYWTVY